MSLTHDECCSKIAEAAAAVSVNEKKWLVMHMHVQLNVAKTLQITAISNAESAPLAGLLGIKGGASTLKTGASHAANS
jgi:hypothetical protein